MGQWSPETTKCRWVDGCRRPDGGAPGSVAPTRRTGGAGRRRAQWWPPIPASCFSFDVKVGPLLISRWTYEFISEGRRVPNQGDLDRPTPRMDARGGSDRHGNQRPAAAQPRDNGGHADPAGSVRRDGDCRGLDRPSQGPQGADHRVVPGSRPGRHSGSEGARAWRYPVVPPVPPRWRVADRTRTGTRPDRGRQRRLGASGAPFGPGCAHPFVARHCRARRQRAVARLTRFVTPHPHLEEPAFVERRQELFGEPGSVEHLPEPVAGGGRKWWPTAADHSPGLMPQKMTSRPGARNVRHPLSRSGQQLGPAG